MKGEARCFQGPPQAKFQLLCDLNDRNGRTDGAVSLEISSHPVSPDDMS